MALRIAQSVSGRFLRQIVQKQRFLSTVCNEEKKGLVVGLYERDHPTDELPRLTPSGELYNVRNDGKLMNLIKRYKMKGVVGEKRAFHDIDCEYNNVVLVGLGREDAKMNEPECMDDGLENIRTASGVGVECLQKLGCNVIEIDCMNDAEQAAVGGSLSAWRYQENKPKEERKSLPKLELFESPDKTSWSQGLFKADAQNLSRTICEIPVNQMTPNGFVEAAIDACCPCGIKAAVRRVDWLESVNFKNLIVASKNSCESPVLLELSYNGDESDKAPVVLVGPGYTVNEDGMCPDEEYDIYRNNVVGSSVVVSAIRACAALNLPINLVALCPLVEYRPAFPGFTCGQMVNMLNGKKVGVHDVENVGRIIMADSMTFAQCTYNPRMMIDVGCMTGKNS
jgi:aminopeptidase